jgi:hypothetical protein
MGTNGNSQLVSATYIKYKDKWLWRVGFPLISLSFIFIANENSFLELV